MPTPPGFPIRLDLKKALPGAVDAGAPFKVEIAVETDSRCDLTGVPFAVLDESGETVAIGALPPIVRLTKESDQYDPRHGGVDLRPSVEIAVTAPARIGSFVWTVTVPACAIDGIRHEAASLAIEFATREHATSLAVWDSPTPIALGAMFELKAGAKCSAGCSLAGETVEVVDADGEVVGTAPLGVSTWPGTSSLYWMSVSVRAPANEGQYRWSVRMARPALDSPHSEPMPVTFSFVVTKPPAHRVSVSVLEEVSRGPVPGAQIRMGPFRASTNEAGRATLTLPGGDFRLRVFKENYDAPEQPVEVREDLEVVIVARALPEEDPYARYWKT